MSGSKAPSARTQVKRIPELAEYDRSVIDGILDEALVCHVGFVDGDQPYVIPTLHARVGDELYLHGSAASRALRVISTGVPICVTVTLLDGLVLARSVFEHSVDYRSVVILGSARIIEDPDEKLRGLEALTEQLIPGRWADARKPNEQEMKATSILSLPLTECSAKVSHGPPDDGESADADLPIWAGNVPFKTVVLQPVPDPLLKHDVPVPGYASDYTRPGWES